MSDETKTEGTEKETRTRQTASAKQTEQATEKTAAEKRKEELEAKRLEREKAASEAKEKREAEREERKAKSEADKAEREKAKAAEKEAKEAEKSELKKAKMAERIEARRAQVDSGALIEVDVTGNVIDGNAEDFDPDKVATTYSLVTEPKKEEVAQRALSVITDLQNGATSIPMPGKELADTYGGGTVQWVAFFGMLRVLGLIKAYRFKTGERGNSGLSYLWVGPTEPYTLETLPAPALAEAA